MGQSLQIVPKILDHRGNPARVVALAGDYEGAGSGRRLSTWGTSSGGPNVSLYSSLATLRTRSRELVRNNPLASGAVDSFVSNLIGSGITPRWQLSDNPDLKAEIQQLWLDSCDELDFAECCDMAGLQSLVANTVIVSGECLVRFRPQLAASDLAVPLQIQVLEPDHLDAGYNTIAPNGNMIRMGIEFNRRGKRVAYWLYKDHPGESFLNSSSEKIRVPASEILHIYRMLRPGQVRGRSWMSSIIVKLHEIDQCVDAELVRRKTTAMFGGFIKEPPSEMIDTSPLGKRAANDSEDREVIALEPGTFPVLPPGMDVIFSDPKDVGGNYVAWMKQQLHDIAKGVGITYEQLTGDLEGVNYSSIRAGLLEFRRFCQQIQMQTLVFQFCRPVARYWMNQAILSGALSIPDYPIQSRQYKRIQWRPDGWPWVDPQKDQKAEIMAIRGGLKSRSQSIAESGGDIETVDREIIEDNARADKDSLIFDSDPRRTTSAGLYQDIEKEEND